MKPLTSYIVRYISNKSKITIRFLILLRMSYRLPNLDVVPLDLRKGNICSGLLQDISVMDSTLYTAHITSNTETLQME